MTSDPMQVAKDAVQQLAPLVARYRASLVEAGLTRAEAMNPAERNAPPEPPA